MSGHFGVNIFIIWRLETSGLSQRRPYLIRKATPPRPVKFINMLTMTPRDGCQTESWKPNRGAGIAEIGRQETQQQSRLHVCQECHIATSSRKKQNDMRRLQCCRHAHTFGFLARRTTKPWGQKTRSWLDRRGTVLPWGLVAGSAPKCWQLSFDYRSQHTRCY